MTTRESAVQSSVAVAMLAALACAGTASAAVPAAERNALIALYNSTGGSSWMDKGGWLGAPGTECTWQNIGCDAAQAHVVSISLYSNNLNGTIPVQLGDLSALQTLQLDFNYLLGGAIPSQLGRLTNLRYLGLQDDSLTGPIPPELGNLSALESLGLGSYSSQWYDDGSNRLTGAIPAQLGNLANLKYLNLSKNQLSGGIPSQLGNLGKLETLNLSWNLLTGSVPPALGSLTKLTDLNLTRNRLTGAIPSQLGSLAAVQNLQLCCNSLRGSIPPQLANLGTLQHADLRWNALHAEDPALIAFLDARAWWGGQTVAPANLAATATNATTVTLHWAAVPGDPGGYRAFKSTSPSGPFTLATTTSDKSATGAVVSGLTPATTYYLAVETYTDPGPSRDTVTSERTPVVSARTPSAPPTADLEVTKTNGRVWVMAGESTTYTITVSNRGPADVAATVWDTFQAPLTSPSWTCTAEGGARCGAPGGIGDISLAVDVPVGGSVRVLATASVPASARGSITNRVYLTPAVGVIDPNADNNTDVDADMVRVLADVSVTNTDGVATVAPGQVVTYTVVVSNPGPVDVNNLTIFDDIPSALSNPTWTCVAAGGGSCGLLPWSGSGDINRYGSLPVGGTITYTISGTLAATPPGTLRNTASVNLDPTYVDMNQSNNAAIDVDIVLCDGNQGVLVSDGRPTTVSVPPHGSQLLVVPTNSGRSYSIEASDPRGISPMPTLALFSGVSGCDETYPEVPRDTTLLAPAVNDGMRIAFSSQGPDPFYRVRVTNSGADAASYEVALAETTCYSPAWSTNGSYDTYYSLQNTTNAPVTVELNLDETVGMPMVGTTVLIPAGSMVSTNTSALGATRDKTGTATLVHDGPPGAILATAAIANFATSPPYVQPVRFETVRESR